MDYGTPFGLAEWLLIVLLILAVVWSAIWKGIALWRAARNHQLVWFVVLLIVNTLGIIEIIYIFGFSRRGSQSR